MPHPPDTHHEPRGIRSALADLIWLITPDCHEVVRLTSEGRDRKLPPVLRFRLHLHRMFCKFCARYLRQIDFLGKAISQLPKHLEQGGGLSPAAQERLKQALRNEGH